MRTMVVFSAFLVLGLVSQAGAAEGDPIVWNARYQVRFGENGQGVPTADVTATLECALKSAECPKSVDVDMYDEDGFPKGYGSFVHEFAATPPEVPSSADRTAPAELVSGAQGHYRIPVPLDGSAHFHYQVVLEHDAGDWGPGPDEAPYRFEGGALWTGRALFITAKGSRVEVSFSAPPGERVATSFAPIPGKEGTYAVAGESRLRDSFLVVGSYRETELHVDKAVVLLALGGNLGDSMPVLEAAIRRFLEAARGVFGGAPERRILVAGNLGASPGSLFGGVFADDVSFLADEPLGPANADRWRPFLCHEIFHLWNGTAIDFPAGQQYWFTEGVTEYYANLLPVRLGEVSGERFLETVAAKAAAYLEATGSIGLQAAGNEKFLSHGLVYEGGALAALSLDLQIRAATSNQRSLDDVLRELYQLATSAKGRGLSYDDVVQTVTKAAGRPLDEIFRRSVLGKEELPLAESLKLAGLQLDVQLAELPDAVAILGQLLRCPSASTVPEGIQILVSKAEPIRTGDILVAVSGSPVKTFDELRLAFQHLKPASMVPVSVLREGKRIELEVVLGGKEGESVPRSRHAEVHVEMLPKADPLALEIRRSILGL